MPLVHRHALQALVDLYEAISQSRTDQHPDQSETYDAGDATRVNNAFDTAADYEKHFRAALTQPDDGPPRTDPTAYSTNGNEIRDETEDC